MMVRAFFRQPVVWGILGVVVMGAVIAAMLVLFHPRAPFSDAILKQVSFSIFYPDGSDGFKVAKDTATYNMGTKVLLFHASNGSQDLTMTEQATPNPINDIPEYYPKLVETLHGYSDLDSVNGKVSLTRPDELKGAQSAVLNGKGTLLFVKPSSDMSNDDWRKFFNSLIIVK